MICAAKPLDNGSSIDACHGDAGGAMVNKGKAFALISWGSGCGHADFPGVYTNLVNFKSWIEKEAFALENL